MLLANLPMSRSFNIIEKLLLNQTKWLFFSKEDITFFRVIVYCHKRPDSAKIVFIWHFCFHEKSTLIIARSGILSNAIYDYRSNWTAEIVESISLGWVITPSNFRRTFTSLTYLSDQDTKWVSSNFCNTLISPSSGTWHLNLKIRINSNSNPTSLVVQLMTIWQHDGTGSTFPVSPRSPRAALRERVI